MVDIKKERKPGRSVFFEDQEVEEQQQGGGVVEIEKDAIDRGTDGNGQLRSLLDVLKAVKQGDFSVRLPTEKDGIMAEIADAFNDVVSLNESIANEIVRVSRIVGEEGQMTERASPGAVTGMWASQIDSVNALINNLAQPTAEVTRVITAVAEGDLAKKMRLDIEGVPVKGEFLRIATITNTMVDQLSAFASEVTRVAREVGTEGQLGAQAEVPGVAGTWKDLTDRVNAMAANLTNQVRNIAEVTTAVAQGDLTRKITVEAMGEIMELKNTINGMVDNLSAFASEVTRVAREVGTEGQLGAQAEVPGVAGTWQELTNNVNMLAANLTNQVRNIAMVSTAIANGDLTQKITVEAQGEILELKDTLNKMVDNLSAIIGDINSVMTMVGEGNLTRMVEVEAAGEFASMVAGINGTLESLRGIITELSEVGTNVGAISQNMLSAGQEMNAMVTQLSSSVGQIAEGAKTQAQQLAEASRESEGVGETAANTVTRADNMRQMSEAANKAATEGSEAMEETIKNTNLMLEGSKESVGKINSLSKSTEQIREVIDIIRDIATQTNILAINAAIEAVRAGRQGRGFAVVAEEVKTLSADSKNQAKNISVLVQSILKETEGTVITINTMAENVETGRRSIEQTSGALSGVARSVGENAGEAQEISVAAGQQKNSIDTVSQSLDKISGIAADTSTSSAQLAESTKALLSNAQELSATSQTLADMSESLQQTVGRFTIGEAVSAKPTPAVSPGKAKSAAKRGAKTPEKARS